eukprot:CFRG1584T1
MRVNGIIRTVHGDITSSEVGLTLAHEHLHINYLPVFKKPKDDRFAHCCEAKISLENIGWIRGNWNCNKHNLTLVDIEKDVCADVADFVDKVQDSTTTSLLPSMEKLMPCIVDVTTHGIRGHDFVQSLKRISKEAGVHVVYGTGYYIAKTHSDEVKKMTIDELCQVMVNEIEVGIEGVKAGIIGELGCSFPDITESEANVLRAAAKAQILTGAAITIHPGVYPESPFQILDILRTAGADISRVIIGHIDRTFGRDLPQLLRLAKEGCIIEYDFFGMSESWTHTTQFNVEIPSEHDRLRMIRGLIDAGYGSQLVIAHDIYTKHRLKKYGGHGFAFIVEVIIPFYMSKGFTESELLEILIETPRRLLTLKK